MSDTAIAIIIFPVLIVLTLMLECTRIGCTWLCRSYRLHGAGEKVLCPEEGAAKGSPERGRPAADSLA